MEGWVRSVGLAGAGRELGDWAGEENGRAGWAGGVEVEDFPALCIAGNVRGLWGGSQVTVQQICRRI